MVRQGKGKKDRIVPIGERALAWVEAYLEEVRPRWSSSPTRATLPDETGEAAPALLGSPTSSALRRARRARQDRLLPLFRHTMATLMLENGADIRFIQEMLGHANLNTTDDTHVSIRKLKEIHAATHPAGRRTDKILLSMANKKSLVLAARIARAVRRHPDTR